MEQRLKDRIIEVDGKKFKNFKSLADYFNITPHAILKYIRVHGIDFENVDSFKYRKTEVKIIKL